NKTDYKARQTECGFGKPSIWSGLPRCLGPPGIFPADLMHYILNIGDCFMGSGQGNWIRFIHLIVLIPGHGEF
ncbi:hypothetical protein B0H14DRAFT_2366395, partial [Mycena olivaceomarginata]